VAEDGSSAGGKTPRDPELERAERDQKLAEARKATAEAEKAAAEAGTARIAERRGAATAGLPTAVAAPLDGTVTMGEGAGRVAEVLAHALVDRAATELAATLKLGESDRVLIVEGRDLVSSDWPYLIVREQLTRLAATVAGLSRQLEDTGQPPEGGQRRRRFVGPGAAVSAIPAVAAGVGVAADLLGLLRTNYTITDRTVAVTSTALIAAVAGALKVAGAGRVVVDGFHVLAASPLITDHMALLAARDELEGRMVGRRESLVAPAQAAVDDLRTEIAEEVALYQTLAGGDTPDTERVSALEERLSRLRERLVEEERALGAEKAKVAAAETVLQTVAAFLATLTAPPGDGGYPPLVAAAIREQLHVDGGVDRILFLAVDSPGGEHITRQGLFRRSGWLQYVAGCQMSWLMAGRDGAIVSSGTRSLLGHLTYTVNQGPQRVRRVDVSVQ
jgi:hypothetical protein